MSEAETANTPNDTPKKQNRIYAVDDPTSKVTLVEKRGTLLITHEFKKADVMQFITLNEAIVRVTEMRPKGEMMKYDEEIANAAHFLEIIVSSTVKKVGDDSEPVALAPEDVRRLTAEHRSKAIQKLYQSKIEVIPNAGASGFAYLFEPTGDEDSSFTTARQLIGDADNPSWVLDHYLRRPGKERRDRYTESTRKVYTDRKGDMPKRHVDVDVRPGIELFQSSFINVSAPLVGAIQYGITVGGHDYVKDSKEDRAAFLNSFLPLWQSEIMAAVVDSFDTDIQD